MNEKLKFILRCFNPYSEYSKLQLNKKENFSEPEEINKRKLIYKLSSFSIIIIIFVLSLIYNSNEIINNKLARQKKELEKYLELCDKYVLLNNKKFKKVEKPKISVVSAVYNQEKYILRFIRSIQNQFFDDIEIILVDDFSKDNTVQLIEQYQTEDERIILIKHKENKGSLISRNDGVLKAKGEYLIIPDSDDILANNTLNYLYTLAKQNNYDMIRFNIYKGERKLFMENLVKHMESRPIYQPELFNYLFFGKGYLKLIDVCISNKLIKREVYYEALNSISSYYLNQYMTNWEDGLINFMLYKKAKSFYFVNDILYYYIQNKESITKTYKNNMEKTIRNGFLYLRFIYQYTNNTKYEKDMASAIFTNIYADLNNFKFYKKITKDYDLYYEVINLYINDKYILPSVKNKMIKIQNVIQEVENINIKNG